MKRDGRSISTAESGGRREAGRVLQQPLDEDSGIRTGEGGGGVVPSAQQSRARQACRARTGGPAHSIGFPPRSIKATCAPPDVSQVVRLKVDRGQHTSNDTCHSPGKVPSGMNEPSLARVPLLSGTGSGGHCSSLGPVRSSVCSLVVKGDTPQLHGG